MKPSTAAGKLGIYLPAAPAEFQQTPITRAELDALRADPPQWLIELRANGPYPRDVVAQKLGVSRSGLSRAGITEALDSTRSVPCWQIRRNGCAGSRRPIARSARKTARLKARRPDAE